MMDYQHWHLETDSDDILWLILDRADQSVNSLNRAVFDEFERIISDVEDNLPAALIIESGKKKGFIAGADISQFTTIKDEADALDLIRQAQLILDRLAALPIPTVAMINGFCLGGGTEVALACRYRVASEERATQIGLPEVKLGLHPGWGGTVRLPPLMGAMRAIPMMLTGRSLSARAAAKLGVVDAAVPERQLRRAARYYALTAPPKQTLGLLAQMANHAWARPLLSRIFMRQLNKKVSEEHYPAPFAIVRNWRKDGAVGDQAMLNEAKSISKLMMGDTGRNLIRVFFLQEKLKALSKGIKYQPKHVHVIGAGTMGGDIAAWCALRGFYVTLQDQSMEKIAPAMKRASKLFKKKLKKPLAIQPALDRLQPDVAGLGVGRADVIIEAVFEDLAVKQAIFKELEAKAKPDAILATNTSSIPLEEIAEVLTQPERLVGIHFFNPVAMMPLVEIVKGTQTAAKVVEQATAFVGKIGRFPLPVASQPGFLVNRMLMPYLMEAMELLEEGVPAATIDQAALDFGMPMGPITLADKVGLDVCLSVAEKLTAHYGGKVPQRLRDLVAAGHCGLKTGEGFYRYKNGQVVANGSQQKITRTPDIGDRMILRMVNEAVACLNENVVDDAELLDAGMIFGTGFAPFRGGPLHYAKARGVKEIVTTLERFSHSYGERFKPYSGWEKIQ